MQRLGRGVCKHENKGDSEHEQADKKPLCRLIKRDFSFFNALYSNTPGTHTQGLPAMSPEPIEEDKSDKD